LGPGTAEDVVLLGIAEDEDVVLPPVVLPLVVFPAAVVLFPDVAFCANVDFVVKFSAATILMANMAVMIKPPNLRVFFIACFIGSILFIDWYHDIYNGNISFHNPNIFRFSDLKSVRKEFSSPYAEIVSISKCKQFCFSHVFHIHILVLVFAFIFILSKV
jgi:hypothetical protein